MPNAEVLAQGGKSASYLTTSRNEFEFYVSTGATDEQLMEKFHLDVDQIAQAREWYEQENTFELDKLLASVALPVETVGPEVEELVEPEPEPDPEYGYVASPLHSYVFIKPLPPEHKGRLITPKAYQTNSDMGFIHAVGPNVSCVKPGDQVMFDKYAAEQEKFHLLDEEGDLIELVTLFVCHTSNIVALNDLIQGKKDGRPESGEVVEPGGICAIYECEDGYEIEPVFGVVKPAEFGTS